MVHINNGFLFANKNFGFYLKSFRVFPKKYSFYCVRLRSVLIPSSMFLIPESSNFKKKLSFNRASVLPKGYFVLDIRNTY